MHFFQTTTIGINEYTWVNSMPRLIIRIRKSKKNKQHNGQKKKDKKTNNDLQNITYKTKDRVTWTLLKTGVELRCSGTVSSFCSTLYQSFIKNMNHITREIFNNGYWYPRHYLMKGIIFVDTQIFFVYFKLLYSGKFAIWKMIVHWSPVAIMVKWHVIMACVPVKVQWQVRYYFNRTLYENKF